MFTVQFEKKNVFLNLKGVVYIDSVNAIEVDRQIKLPHDTKIQSHDGDVLISYKDHDTEKNIRIVVEQGMRDRIIFG